MLRIAALTAHLGEASTMNVTVIGLYRAKTYLVIRLAIALHLSIDDSDDLLMCAGYAPLLRMRSA